jgi:hypothetical protein
MVQSKELSVAGEVKRLGISDSKQKKVLGMELSVAGEGKGDVRNLGICLTWIVFKSRSSQLEEDGGGGSGIRPIH